MLLKTESLEKYIYDNIWRISFRQPRTEEDAKKMVIGSFAKMRYTMPVTDIDIKERVTFNEKWVEILKKIIRRNQYDTSPFYFLTLGCGKKKDFIPPWKFGPDGEYPWGKKEQEWILEDEKIMFVPEGECVFNIHDARKWFDEFASKKLLAQNKLQEIHDILYGKSIRVNQIMNIDKILEENGEIYWTQEDILKGYKVLDDHKYDFLSTVKKNNVVIEYALKYKNYFIKVDFGMLGTKINRIPKYINRYYTQDWYKIMKTFRYKLREEYVDSYKKLMEIVLDDTSLRYMIELLEDMYKYKLPIAREFQETVSNMLKEYDLTYTPNLKHNLEKSVQSYCKKYVKEYSYYLKEEYYKEYVFRVGRAYQANRPRSMQKLEQGVCGFFEIPFEYFKLITNVSARSKISIKKILKCLEEMSKEFDLNMFDVLRTIDNNTLYIQINKNDIELHLDGVMLKSFPKKHLKELQILTLIDKNENFI